MHPDDCAEFVAEEFDALQRALSARPELQIKESRLEDRFQIHLLTRVRRFGTMGAFAQSGLLLPGGQRLQQAINVPDLSARQERLLIIHADCDDFDGQPPLVDLLNPEGAPLAPLDWPKDNHSRGIVANHPLYKRPFFCRPGVREYHEHPQHEDDPWDRHREGYSLHRSLLSIVADLQTRFVL